MFPPRLGINTLQKIEPPEDFWPPQSMHGPAGHDRSNEPAMLLRLAGVAAVIAIMIAAALMAA